MGLSTHESAVLSAIIFNALIIPALVPLALKGVRYRPMPAGPLLARNLSVFGLGGLVAPFVGIKLIDLAVSGLHPAYGPIMLSDLKTALRPPLVLTLLLYGTSVVWGII